MSNMKTDKIELYEICNKESYCKIGYSIGRNEKEALEYGYFHTLKNITISIPIYKFVEQYNAKKVTIQNVKLTVKPLKLLPIGTTTIDDLVRVILESKDMGGYDHGYDIMYVASTYKGISSMAGLIIGNSRLRLYHANARTKSIKNPLDDSKIISETCRLEGHVSDKKEGAYSVQISDNKLKNVFKKIEAHKIILHKF